MNLVLFLVLFTVGFLTVRIPGNSFWMEFAFLTISAFVALNPQVPVPSQTIYRSGPRAPSVSGSNYPVSFAPRYFAGNHSNRVGSCAMSVPVL
jgi:hypothetical protein